jgi:hypothetical protein
MLVRMGCIVIGKRKKFKCSYMVKSIENEELERVR